MMELYNTILYQPLLNATVFLYNFIPGSDFGLAIITLTILIRVIMFPLTLKTAKSQRAMAKINPHLKAIKEKFKNDSQAQSAAIMNLYKENNITERDTLVAIHPWTSDPIKQWPRDYFLELALRLKELAGLKVIIIGGKEEADKSGNLYSAQSGLINLAGSTTLKQLAALLSRCKLLISGDSGPVHLASGVGGRVLALFRNDIQGKTAKRWGPWGEGHYVIEKNNLSDITVDEVFNKAKEMLA